MTRTIEDLSEMVDDLADEASNLDHAFKLANLVALQLIAEQLDRLANYYDLQESAQLWNINK